MSAPGYSGSAFPTLNVAPSLAAAGAALGVVRPGLPGQAAGSAGSATGAVRPGLPGPAVGAAGAAVGGFVPGLPGGFPGSAGAALGLVKPGAFPRLVRPSAGQALGVLQAAAQLGLDAILVKPRRSIGPFVAQVTILEDHNDELEITEHPVEIGASITDYAFKRPAELTIECAWSNSPSTAGLIEGIVGGVRATIDGVTQTVQSALTGNASSQVRDIYNRLLELQASKIPFDVYTGKRFYRNMLIKSLRTRSDSSTENSLPVTATFRELIVVSTSTLLVSVPRANQPFAGATTPTNNTGQKALLPSNRFTPQVPLRALP